MGNGKGEGELLQVSPGYSCYRNHSLSSSSTSSTQGNLLALHSGQRALLASVGIWPCSPLVGQELLGQPSGAQQGKELSCPVGKDGARVMLSLLLQRAVVVARRLLE